MKSIQERYLNDPVFHNLVVMMVSHIDAGKFTPSEMRDAAVYASTLYEINNVKDFIIPDNVEKSFDIISDYIKRRGNDIP